MFLALGMTRHIYKYLLKHLKHIDEFSFRNNRLRSKIAVKELPNELDAVADNHGKEGGADKHIGGVILPERSAVWLRGENRLGEKVALDTFFAICRAVVEQQNDISSSRAVWDVELALDDVTSNISL